MTVLPFDSYAVGMNLKDDPVRVGATVRALRDAYGWKLSKFAVAIGTTHGHLANIEAGRKNLTPEMARKVADTLDVPLAAITTSFEVDDIVGQPIQTRQRVAS